MSMHVDLLSHEAQEVRKASLWLDMSHAYATVTS